MKERMLIWWCSWAGLFEDIVGIFTLGYIRTGWKLDAGKYLAKWRHRRRELTTPKD